MCEGAQSSSGVEVILADKFRKGKRGKPRAGEQVGLSRVTKEARAARAREAKSMHGTPGQAVELELGHVGTAMR